MVRKSTPQGRPKLFVAERFAGVAREGDESGATFLAEARRLATLAGSNIARVIELVLRGDDALVFSELVDGETLASTWLSAGLPLEVTLRIVLDVLCAADAIHAVRDTKQRPMHLCHGELSTATVLVGLDGVARVLHAIERRMAGTQAERASLGYLAPEVHKGAAFDARADVFGVGVLLWEALSARRLFDEGDASAIVARVQGGGVGPASAPSKATWATSLVQIAARALAPAPGDRWPTASAMAAEIRKAAGLRLAPATAAATFAKATFSEPVKTRRERLESMTAMTTAPEPVSDTAPTADAPAPDTARAANAGAFDVESDLVPTTISPPPLPARALRPSAAALEAAAAQEGPASEDDTIEESTPYFEAAVDLSVAPPASDPPDAGPTTIAPFPPVFDERSNRRRMVAVLGGVGALGLIVFSLAAWRVARHESRALAVLPLQSVTSTLADPRPATPAGLPRRPRPRWPPPRARRQRRSRRSPPRSRPLLRCRPTRSHRHDRWPPRAPRPPAFRRPPRRRRRPASPRAHVHRTRSPRRSTHAYDPNCALTARPPAQARRPPI